MVLPRRGLTQRGAWLVNWLLIASAAAIAALVGFRGHGAGLVRVRRLGTPTAADTLSLSQRVELLEAQLQAHTALGADPLAAEAPVAGVCTATTALCPEHCALQAKGVAKFATECDRAARAASATSGNACGRDYDHEVCLSAPSRPSSIKPYAFPQTGRRCTVLDFGIRQQPQFSEAMSLAYNCTVHAFDPSPVTLRWIQSSGLLDNGNIHFHQYGAGAIDGKTFFAGYNWDQVSIMHPFVAQACALSSNDTSLTNSSSVAMKQPFRRECRDAGVMHPGGSLEVNVRTLPSIMSDLGLAHVDIVKIDVEGSEFAFLSQALLHYAARGLPFPADQLALEVHHYTQSPLYGAARSPEVAELSQLLNTLGGMELFYRLLPGGWSDKPLQAELPPARYNLLSFISKAPRGTVLM